MRILHVIGGLAPRYGGPSKVLPEMCAALAARGHEVEVITTNIDGTSILDVPLGVPIPFHGGTAWYFAVHQPRHYGTSLPLLGALRARIDDFDVVHVHSLYLFHTLVACHLCRARRIPYVLRPHGTLDPYHRSRHRLRKFIYDVLVERRNCEGAAAIHCTSETEKRHIEATGVTTPCVVIPLGVRLEEPAFAEKHGVLEERYPELAGARLVTFLGRLARKKGLGVLIEGFADVARRLPDVRLVVAGPEDDVPRRELLRQARATGCFDRILFTGLLTDDAKADLLRHTSVFALPSADESFGVSVVEAMAAGAPVVITCGVGLAQEVLDAGAGLVVERTREGLARGLLNILEDPERGRTMGNLGRELVRSTFSWPAIARQLEVAYAESTQRVAPRLI